MIKTMEVTSQLTSFKIPESSNFCKTFEDFGVSAPSDFYIKRGVLLDTFEKVQKKQGWFARKWDDLKNVFGMKSGSKNVKDVLSKVKTGQVEQAEGKKVLEKYIKQQSSVSQGAMNFISSMLVMGAAALPLKKKGTVILSLLTGVLSRVGLGAFEASTNKVEGDYTFKKALKDTSFGLVIGGIGPLGKLGALKLEDKVSLKLFKFIAMNAVATGGTSVFNSVPLAAGLLNRDFAKSFDEKYTNKKQNEERLTILMPK